MQVMELKGKLADVGVIAFDVYGTLIDVRGVVDLLSTEFGAEAGPRLAARWREKQLEYSFRRSLMERYADFPTCTRQALRWICNEASLDCSRQTEDSLMQAYARLPAFADVGLALKEIRKLGGSIRTYAFSNGTATQVLEVLGNAGIAGALGTVVSVDDIGCFKPSPKTYRHFLECAGIRDPGQALLVSSNMFDVMGAVSSGMKAAWINRAGQPWEPWEFEPTVELATLEALPDLISH